LRSHTIEGVILAVIIGIFLFVRFAIAVMIPTGKASDALFTLRTSRALRASIAFFTLGAGRASRTLGASRARFTSFTLGASRALRASITLLALRVFFENRKVNDWRLKKSTLWVV
jgi:hypothetical protein